MKQQLKIGLIAIFIFSAILVGFIYLLNININRPSSDIESIWTDAERKFVLAELDRTTDMLIISTRDLSSDQANFKQNINDWSITQIVEHLEVQNELHFREIMTIAKTPEMLKYISIVAENDSYFQYYATDSSKSKARWFLEPIGRFGTKDQALEAFIRARNHLRKYVEETEVDLRKHFTFRKNIEELPRDQIKLGDVRDLHQLLLTGIAHTDRHIAQIKRILEAENFPR